MAGRLLCLLLLSFQSIIVLNHLILCARTKEEKEVAVDVRWLRPLYKLQKENAFIRETASTTIKAYELMAREGKRVDVY